MRHVLAIDQGTTGTTVLVLNEALEVKARGYQEFQQIYPQPGWVEHSPTAIWDSLLAALKAALTESKIDTASIACIGITNQRETTVLWDRKTGQPECNAIVWQDRRTADRCDQLKKAGREGRVRELTGLVLDPYFSGTKLQWMLDQDAGRRQRAESGQLAFGTIDSYLVSQLSRRAAHVTDVTNASRTLLFDLGTREWSPELLELFKVPEKVLPTVKTSAEVYAETKGVPGLPDGIPISGIAGDQQSALFGQACFEPGEAKCTYGTGSFILMNTGDTPVKSDHGLLTTCAWALGQGDEAGEVAYALEGSSFIAGAAVQWLRDGLGIIDDAKQVEALAGEVPDTGGVIVVPAFAGLGAPHWRPDARAHIAGLTRGSTRAHIARATLEGIALQQYEIVKAMEADSGRSLSLFKVDGGAASNDLLMQMQSDFLGTDISRPEIVETTALGAAFLAGLGAGVWKSKQEIRKSWRENKRFSPARDKSEIAELLVRWKKAVADA